MIRLHRSPVLYSVLFQLKGGPEVMEELITLDAIGCFEDDEDYEEEGSEDEVSEQVSVLFDYTVSSFGV